MKVSEITINPPILLEDDTIELALQRINDKGIGRVLVTNINNELIGIISTRDLLGQFIQQYDTSRDIKSFLAIKLKDIMSKNLIFAYEDDDILDALTLMVIRNIGSLPIIDRNNHPKGIITERSLLVLYDDVSEDFKVGLFSTKKVQTIKQSFPIIDAIRMMIRRGFRRLPVENENRKIIGIITATDIIKLLARLYSTNNIEKILDLKVNHVMKTHIETIEFDEPLKLAAKKLLEKNIGSLLILDNEGSVKGIITERDMLFGLYHILLYRKYFKQIKTM